MKTHVSFRRLAFSIAVILLLSGCSKNMVTGKSQLSLIPEKELQDMAFVQYKEFLSKSNLMSPADKSSLLVKEVGTKLSAAVERYFASKNLPDALKGYQWEYNLAKDSIINAWCMPGGKILVYTGILPVTQNANALAVVMGHEVSHALLQHGNQRMSESMLQQLGGVALSVALSKKPTETQNIFLNAYGIGTEIGVMLPFSRKQELEADRFGLIWAAMAGYDINEAIPFWERMQSNTSGEKVPEFLSTHPSNSTRIQKIKQYLTEASTYTGK